METRATLLQRLKADGSSREIAWAEFVALYGPIIARFARARGVRPEDVEEVVQDVVAGFFAAQPKFVYDPARGRFRAYLMACVSNAVRTQLRRASGAASAMPERAECASTVSDPDWDAAWKSSALDSALARLRERYSDNTTFQAFEAVVIRGQTPEVVADALGISRDSVYQARTRLLAKLRLELDAVERTLDPE